MMSITFRNKSCKGEGTVGNIKIERYKESDFIEVIALLVSSFNSKFTYKQSLSNKVIEDVLYSVWEIKEEDPSYLHLVAKDGEKVVGVILVRLYKSKKEIKRVSFIKLCKKYGVFNVVFLMLKLWILDKITLEECYIEHIAVAESMRGRGVGELLINVAEKYIKNIGFDSVSLIVAEGNKAKKLYHKKGFKDVDMISSYLKYYFIGIKKWMFMRKYLV